MRHSSALRVATLVGGLLAAPSLAAQDSPRAGWTMEPFGTGFWFAGEHMEAAGTAPFQAGGTTTSRRAFLRLRTAEQYGAGVHLLRTAPSRPWGLFFEAAYTRAAAAGGGRHVVEPGTAPFVDSYETSGSVSTVRAALGVRRFLRRGERVELFGDAGLMLARTTIALDGNIAWLPDVPLSALDGTRGPGIESSSVFGGTRDVATHGGPVLALGATFPVAEALRLTARLGLAALRQDPGRTLDGLLADTARRSFWAPARDGAEARYRLVPGFTIGLRFGATGARTPGAGSAARAGSATAARATEPELFQRHATVYRCENEVRFSARLTTDSAFLELPFAPARLARDRREGRLRYADPDVSFEPSGGEADLASRFGTLRGCRGTAADTPWDEAALLGYDFRALGQEPGWLLDLDFDGEARLRWIPMEGERVYMPLPAGRREADGSERYAGEFEGRRMEIEITPRACSDVMSGAAFTHTVRVRVNGEERAGCGRRLTPRPAAPGSDSR